MLETAEATITGLMSTILAREQSEAQRVWKALRARAGCGEAWWDLGLRKACWTRVWRLEG